MTSLAELIGESAGIVALRERAGRLLRRQADARRLAPTLILGETGTGKGLLAHILHRAGPRADGPFVDVNCAAIPETLLEAELFGFERGAFTDARQAKPGLLQTAHRGTIFLDEVGLLPEALQAKLLKAIEEHAVRRLGSTRSEPVDVWVLTASNEDLTTATRLGRFREDLYHRLAVVTLALPPLRDRGEDILRLAEHFLARACADYELPPKAFSPEARAALLAHRWPGNIRELANLMERVALLSDVSEVTAEVLGLSEAPPPLEPGARPSLETTIPLDDAVGNLERLHVLEALRQTGWNVTRAAARLGISRDKVRYRIAKHGLRGPASPPNRAPSRHPRPGSLATAFTPTTVSAPGSVRWERRRLALLRAALAVAPEVDARLYPSRALELLVEKVQSFGGRVEELSPTGLVAAFGVQPVEDAPRRAAHAAMAIRAAAERGWDGASRPEAVRFGIHVGYHLVGQASGGVQIDLEGKHQACTILETLVGRAEPGVIVVSQTSASLLERHFDVVPMDVPDGSSGQTYRLARSERTGLRFKGRMAKFVGRHQELEFLRSRLASTIRGQGQVVGILGEAGIGKSRLLFEFRRTLSPEQVTYLAGRCHSHASAIPYLPVLHVLRKFCGISEIDGLETVTQKIRLALQAVGMDAEDSVPYLRQFLGVGKEGEDSLAVLSPEAVRSRTLARLHQMALQGSRRRPTIFAVEDLQWIDKSSEEFLNLLIERLAGARILVLCTYRPGYRPPWMDKSYATQIALQPLSPEESLSVVHSVLRRPRIPDSVLRLILDKAEGNPFFLEEMSRVVDDQADLGEPDAVPDTIEEVLLARIHRLPEETRRLLQTASVLGREVSLRLLGAIWDGPGPPEPHLQELTRQEFLMEETRLAEPVYVFKHALTQEVACGSLMPAHRQALHAAAGRAVETLYADRLEESYDRLAYHYSRADQADKAVDYLTRLAERAARGHALTESIRALEQALAHVERLPADERDQRRLDLILREASSLIYLGSFQEALGLLLRRQAGVERLQDPALSGRYYFLLARTYLFLGDQGRAVQSAQRSIAEAQQCGDQITMGKAYYLLAQEAPLSGRTPEGIEHGQRALELLARTGQQWWIGQAHWALGLNHAQMGEFERALKAEARARAIGDAIESRQVQASAAWATGVIHAAMGDFEAGIEACQRALSVAPDPLTRAVALGWLGYAYTEQGDGARAIPLLEQSAQQLGQFQFPQFQGWFTVFLAEAYRLIGETDIALDLAVQALGISGGAQSLYGVGMAQRALGRIAQASGVLPDAETHLVQALRTFAPMQARYDLARTHLDLAVVAHAQDRPDAAAAHLREAHALFSAMRVASYAERTSELARALAGR